jgi:hypothetical protein
MSVILSAGVPGDGRFCRCWGEAAKDLLFSHVEEKQILRSLRSLRMTPLKVFKECEVFVDAPEPAARQNLVPGETYSECLGFY